MLLVYLKYFKVTLSNLRIAGKYCFQVCPISLALWQRKIMPLSCLWAVCVGGSSEHGDTANRAMQKRISYVEQWHRPYVNIGWDNNIWNCWTGLSWYNQQIWLVEAVSIWLEISSLLEIEEWHMVRCVLNAVSVGPRKMPRLAEPSLVLSQASQIFHYQNSTGDKQKVWWDPQPLSSSMIQNLCLRW